MAKEKDKWLEQFYDNLRTEVVEKQFDVSMNAIEFYHYIGEFISNYLNDLKQHLNTNSTFDVVKALSGKIKKSPSTIYRAIQFYSMAPNLEQWLNQLPEGKNISWRKICTNYLPGVPKPQLPPYFLVIVNSDLHYAVSKGEPDYNFVDWAVVSDDGVNIKKIAVLFSLKPAKETVDEKKKRINGAYHFQNKIYKDIADIKKEIANLSCNTIEINDR